MFEEKNSNMYSFLTIGVKYTEDVKGLKYDKEKSKLLCILLHHVCIQPRCTILCIPF